jgi:hypothetical protein
MRKFIIVLFTAMLLLNCVGNSSAQQYWPQSSTSLSGSAYTLLMVSVLNLSVEKMYHRNRDHYGFVVGISRTKRHWDDDEVGFGPHAAFVYLSGSGSNHYDGKVGVSLIVYNMGTDEREVYPIPVLSVGYRRQAPGGKTFFRCGLSTAGLGIGFGYVF